jgi:RNA polymerase primary sigma factor
MRIDEEERQLVARMLAGVRERQPLDSERQRELARRIQVGIDARARLEGDSILADDGRARLEEAALAGREAKHELVTAHLPLVVGMARRYRWSPLPFLELIQEGSLGLLRAAERFDWRRGTPFGAYAAWWVRHAMSKAVRESTGSVRLPDRQRARLRSFAEARAAHPGASADELGEAASVEENAAAELVPLLGSPVPIEAALDGGRNLEELIANRDAEEELEEVLVSADAARVRAVAGRVLGDQKREVLEARYGLGGREPSSADQVVRAGSASLADSVRPSGLVRSTAHGSRARSPPRRPRARSHRDPP